MNAYTPHNEFFTAPVTDPEVRWHLEQQGLLALHEQLVRYRIPHDLDQTGGDVYAINYILGDYVLTATCAVDDEHDLYLDTVRDRFAQVEVEGDGVDLPVAAAVGLTTERVIRSFDSAAAGRRDFMPPNTQLLAETRDRYLANSPEAFAVAMAQRTGWPLVVVTDQHDSALHLSYVHVGVHTPTGTILDAGGEWSQEQWLTPWVGEYEDIYDNDPDLPDAPNVHVREVRDVDLIGHDLAAQDQLRIGCATLAVLSTYAANVRTPPRTVEVRGGARAAAPDLGTGPGPQM